MVELEVAARLADRERELEAQHWVRELQRTRREQPVGSCGKRQAAGWRRFPSHLWWLALPGRFGRA